MWTAHRKLYRDFKAAVIPGEHRRVMKAAGAATLSTAAGADVSIKEGGAQVEYEDENPEIHRLFEADLASHGATCQMKGLISSCTGDVGEVLKGAA